MWTTAAQAGHTDAQNNLGILLATRMDPPELDEARRWYTTAAQAGQTGAQKALERCRLGLTDYRRRHHPCCAARVPSIMLAWPPLG